MMLWQHYVFRRGPTVEDTWDHLFKDREISILYISGRGFDPRAQVVLKKLVASLQPRTGRIKKANQLLVGMQRYELDDSLKTLTVENAAALKEIFSPIGSTEEIIIDSVQEDGEEVSTNNALRLAVAAVIQKADSCTDIVLDVSSLPRVAYLSILTGVLKHLVPDKDAPNALFAQGVNFQVLVAEDAGLDEAIVSEDPSAELVTIPGYSAALHAESMQDWPMVWLPILGTNRLGQLSMVKNVIPDDAEILPIVPHPSRGLRKAESLLLEYKSILIDRLQVPMSNFLYVSESNPFEVYRQLLNAMSRYKTSLAILGGCRLAVTPLSSKLATLGAGLSCFEMGQSSLDKGYGITIPYAEPMRYLASRDALVDTRPHVASLLLTGSAYE